MPGQTVEILACPPKRCDNPAAVALAVARQAKTPRQAETSARRCRKLHIFAFGRARIGYLSSRPLQHIIPLETERSFSISASLGPNKTLTYINAKGNQIILRLGDFFPKWRGGHRVCGQPVAAAGFA
jgi:hypothetical protein